MKINVLALGALLAAGLYAQGEGMQPEGFPDIGDPCCITGGVQLTVQALVNALLDPRPVVRSLAAEKLAQDKEKAAAQSALLLHDESCVDSLLGLIRSEEDSPLSGPQGEEIRVLAVRCLANTSSEVRLAAARVLASAASVPALQKAVGAEQGQFN
jgi:HEAT repeat protein